MQWTLSLSERVAGKAGVGGALFQLSAGSGEVPLQQDPRPLEVCLVSVSSVDGQVWV